MSWKPREGGGGVAQIKMDNGSESNGVRTILHVGAVCDHIAKRSSCCITAYHSKYNHRALLGYLGAALEWDQADRCRDHARVGQEYDVEGDAAHRCTQPSGEKGQGPADLMESDKVAGFPYNFRTGFTIGQP